ncbi:hypothetical protein QAD02_018273 [Eretmocerus hayati]|uniref:Uncharacterized protein n=1 Tax=Eretmocerus hayati TaxID=131215 RepID=A0ACC2PI53_9HYME|nr:hypothetical protein QAD02_018273 [Eretmocerus hayati]
MSEIVPSTSGGLNDLNGSVQENVKIPDSNNTTESTTKALASASDQAVKDISDSNNLKRKPPASTASSDEILSQQTLENDDFHDSESTSKFKQDQDGFTTPSYSKKRSNKKSKVNESEKIAPIKRTVDEILLPIKENFKILPSEDHVSFEKVQGFLQKSWEKLVIDDALQDFSDIETTKLMKTIETIHSFSSDSAVKSRLTRLKNKIGVRTTGLPNAVLPNDSDSDDHETPPTHARGASFSGSINGGSRYKE